MHLRLCSLRHCRSLRSLTSNQLSGTIPPQLGNLMNLHLLYPQNRIVLQWHCIITDVTLYITSDLCINYLRSLSLHHCRSLRYLDTNDLTGTIPPQLGNLTMLTRLYAQNLRPPLTLVISDLTLFAFFLVSDFIIVCEYDASPIAHCVIFAHSGTSTPISSVAPFHLSSATSRCSPFCTLRVAMPSIGTVHYLWFDIICGFNLWFDTLFNLWICDASSIVLIASGPSPWMISVAPSHLSSATSRCCKICTLRIAMSSIDIVKCLKWHNLLIIISDLTIYW